MSKFGNYIRVLRNEKGMTQAHLADLLFVTDKAVSKWERNLSYPDISLFPKLADILGVSVSDLINAADDGNTEDIENIYSKTQDIRTPIHIIIGCADLIEKYSDDAERRKRYLDVIRMSGLYLLDMCEKYSSTVCGNENKSADDLEKYYRTHTDTVNQVRYDFTGRRILIAEDIELNREIAAELIRATGAEAEFAENGKICLDKIREAPAGYYDLILMDISMPVMDGIEATKQIRALDDREKSMIPIIAVTANVYDLDRRAALGAGMNSFTEKPVDTGHLYSTINKYL